MVKASFNISHATHDIYRDIIGEEKPVLSSLQTLLTIRCVWETEFISDRQNKRWK